MKASFQPLVSTLFLAATFVAATPIPQSGLPSTGTAIGDACLKNPTSAFCGMGGSTSGTSGLFPRQLDFNPPTGHDCLKNPTKAFCGANTGAFPRQLSGLPNEKDCLAHPTEAFCGDMPKIPRQFDASALPNQEECLANPTKAFCGKFGKRQAEKFLECQKNRDAEECAEFFAAEGPKRDLGQDTTDFLAYANDCDKHPEHCDIPTKPKRQFHDYDDGTSGSAVY